MRLTTKQAAKGKWDGIIAQLISEQAVSRRHGPCPICEGTDRYRYDNKRDDGDWYCNVCGVGDGFRLLQESLGINFAEAARRVDKIVNNIEAKPFTEKVDTEKRRSDLNRVWAEATAPDQAIIYLESRGIPRWVIQRMKDVRGHDKLFYTDMSRPSNVSYIPAMVSLIRNAKGEAISIHRTYIGKDKKIMPPTEKITGGCIRLGEPEQSLVLAEGVETALAAWAITGIPAWATISAHGMEEFTAIPKHVTQVIVCADNDYSFTGQAAAFKCARYMKTRLKIDTEVWMPPNIGMDMLHYLNEEQWLSDDGRVREKESNPDHERMMKWRGR